MMRATRTKGFNVVFLVIAWFLVLMRLDGRVRWASFSENTMNRETLRRAVLIKILYKNLDLAQDFHKISFYFLWVNMLPKKPPKIFRWSETWPLGKILAQDFYIAAVTKILRRRDKSIAPPLSTENCKNTPKNHTACMAATAIQR